MKTLNKNHIRVAALVAIVPALLMFSSCGGDPEPEPTAGEVVLTNLVGGQWKVGSVTVDGMDKSSLFSNLTITFASSQTADGKPVAFNGSFTTTNGGPIWPASGNWTITDPTVGTNLSRSDGVVVQLTEVTASQLKFNLAWGKNTFGSGKVGSVKGQHSFTLGH
jgi:hypothetical protein